MTTRYNTRTTPQAACSGFFFSLLRWTGTAATVGRTPADSRHQRAAATRANLRITLACTMIAIIGTWASGVRFAEVSCAASSIQVSADPILLPSYVIPVRWWIDPSCPVIETGLLLGTEPAVLTPGGPPIYGYRERYEQDLLVAESGRYWVAAYVRDESGALVQSSPQMVVIVVPPVFPDDPHGSHGAPPSYAGDDTDFSSPPGSLTTPACAARPCGTSRSPPGPPPGVSRRKASMPGSLPQPRSLRC